jgi:hypothetical protein
MPFSLTVDTFPAGGGYTLVRHTFFGETKDECREKFSEHAEGCEKLGPAISEGRVKSYFETIDDDDWPMYDPD